MNKEEKTISWLSTKTWYRFLKVFYIFLFVIAGVITVFFVYASTTTSKDTYIVCNYGNKKTFTVSDSGFLYLSEKLSDWTDAEKEHVQQMCQITQNELRAKLETYHYDSPNYGKDTKQLFEIKSAIQTAGGVIHIIIYSILWLFIVGLFFEISKRAFYYIVTGKVNPSH